ncbi:hypothetical protein Tco_1482713 [Tanacetum coccineum]
MVTYGTAVSFAAAYDEYVLLSAKCQENCEFDWLLGARGQFKFVPVVTWTLYRFFYFEPMKPLVKDEEASDVDVHLYRSMIGSLMYLYLKGKPKLGLWYPKVSLFDLKAYSDSDYAGANLDRKSTTSGCQFLGGRATQTTQIPTSTIFGDDETIAQVLINMSQAKVVSREKEKGVEFKDAEETEKPRPTSTRSLLTLKPLPKIDPKDKGKKKIEEEDESESESDGEEERKRLAEEEATNDALIRNFDDIKARIEADRLLAEKLQEEEREHLQLRKRKITS